MNISGPAAVAKPEMLFYAPGDLTVTENQMLWVQKMNNLKNAAMEIVSNELIYR